MGFPRQEYWNGLPCPPPGDLPDPGFEPTSPVTLAQADSLPTEPLEKPQASREEWERREKQVWSSLVACGK